MNKKLIALAVAGACVAPAAMAQTANPVTLYGRIYATFENVPSHRRYRCRRNLPQPSQRPVVYLGVKGTEDPGWRTQGHLPVGDGFCPGRDLHSVRKP